MDNPYEHLRLAAGQQSLFGRTIEQSEIIDLISKYPASQWLDLFAKIEGFLVIQRDKNFDSQTYLAGEIFCPSALQRTQRPAYAKNIYFSLGQLNLARKLAIAYGSNESPIEMSKIDATKVLLGVHDLHLGYDDVNISEDLDKFSRFVIRNGYLNGDTDSAGIFSRSYRIYAELEDKTPLDGTGKTFSELFQERVGVQLKEAIALSFALATPFFQSLKDFWTETTIYVPSNYFRKTTIDKALIETVIDSMSVDFDVVKATILSEIYGKDLLAGPYGYDLSAFRKTPLIKMPDGNLICANLPCLLQKATSNVLWMPTRNVIDRIEKKKLVNDLTDYRGRQFESYLRELCQEMQNLNDKQSFHYISDAKDGEFGDAILVQGNKAVIFEAKSRQFLEKFKSTGNWSDDPHFMEEILKAADQIDSSAETILSKYQDRLCEAGVQLEEIYPVILMYEAVPMHGKVQRLIREKVRESGKLVKGTFKPLEVISIKEIEAYMDMANTLTFIELLERKHSDGPHADEASLYNYICDLTSKEIVISNGWGRRQYDKFANDVLENFFKGKFL